MRRLTGTFIAAVSLAVVGCTGTDAPPVDPGSGTGEVAQLPASAVAQIEALRVEKEARTPAQRKISSQLLYAHSGKFDAVAKAAGAKVGLSMLAKDTQGRVLVDVKGPLGSDPRALVEAAGGTVLHSTAQHGSARAWLSLDNMESLAANASISSVRPASMSKTDRANSPRGGGKFTSTSYADRVAAVQSALQKGVRAHAVAPRIPLANSPVGHITNTGIAESEGDAAMSAVRARKFFNVDGTGVKVGVLSDSDDFKETSIATGDLPADTVTVPGQDGRPGGGEGTAMMEIVHDLAPGAKLFFATANTDEESFADNIRTLRFVYHCDVIVDDVIYFDENKYQDGIVAQAVNDVIADGAMYFSSAGNEGNFNDGTSGTWEGDFKSGGTLDALPAGYTVADFGDKVVSNRIEVGGGPLTLHWADPGTLDSPTSSNDYDIFILDPDLRNVLAAGTDIQDGTGIPWEWIPLDIPGGFRIVVAHVPGAKTRAMTVTLFGGELGLATPGAVFGHNSAAGAFAVAAVDAFEASGGEFVAGPTTPVEVFSSDGYRQMFWNADGSPINGRQGTFASGNGVQLKKPEIAGADGVTTTLPGFTFLNPFFGTSAAAPHVGAVAALIKSAVPSANGAKIRKAILAGALDIEAQGYDRDSGAGIASAMGGLTSAGAKPAVFLDLGAITATPSDGADAILPGGAVDIKVTLVNNGGAVARAVTAVLSSNSPFVTVTHKTGAYPDIPAGGSASNVKPYGITIAADAPCGATLPLTLTASFTGRGDSPKVFQFGVRVGRVSAPTSIAYTGPPVEVPDGDDIGVDIQIPVDLGGAPVAGVSFHIDGDTCTADAGSTTVGVDHTWVGDLVFTLTSPAGTAVTLIDHAGGTGNSGNNFCQTVLDDSAAESIQDVSSLDAPFTGTFAPASPQTAYSGEDGDGTWTLNVADETFFDTGSVRAFTLDVSTITCN